MATTIQISGELQLRLQKRKFSERETYEEVIWDLLEDTMEINEETKREIELGRKQAKEGKTYSLESVKKEFGL
ncbi:hypothetical protein HZA96_02515 [Candidatus Woesearchaeota archaeon]|nr:hypothetical protein [Candidatus Woesearchaeota archaeon]